MTKRADPVLARMRQAEQKHRYYMANRKRLIDIQKRWNRKNRQRINARKRERYQNDPAFAMMQRLRVRLGQTVGTKKSASTKELVGLDSDAFVVYIEQRFKDGMTWERRSEWHLDHIVPLAHWGDAILDADVQRKAFHYTNLQPLWGSENCSKSARYDGGRVWVEGRGWRDTE